LQGELHYFEGHWQVEGVVLRVLSSVGEHPEEVAEEVGFVHLLDVTSLHLSRILLALLPLSRFGAQFLPIRFQTISWSTLQTPEAGLTFWVRLVQVSLGDRLEVIVELRDQESVDEGF